MTGVSHPNSVAVGSNNFLYTGTSALYGTTDVWVFDPTVIEQFNT
ncbi:MAG: hypothetical protein P8Y28_11055 [Gammaproteobacteria bacterium]